MKRITLFYTILIASLHVSLLPRKIPNPDTPKIETPIELQEAIQHSITHLGKEIEKISTEKQNRKEQLLTLKNIEERKQALLAKQQEAKETLNKLRSEVELQDEQEKEITRVPPFPHGVQSEALFNNIRHLAAQIQVYERQLEDLQGNFDELSEIFSHTSVDLVSAQHYLRETERELDACQATNNFLKSAGAAHTIHQSLQEGEKKLADGRSYRQIPSSTDNQAFQTDSENNKRRQFSLEAIEAISFIWAKESPYEVLQEHFGDVIIGDGRLASITTRETSEVISHAIKELLKFHRDKCPSTLLNKTSGLHMLHRGIKVLAREKLLASVTYASEKSGLTKLIDGTLEQTGIKTWLEAHPRTTHRGKILAMGFIRLATDGLLEPSLDQVLPEINPCG